MTKQLQTYCDKKCKITGAYKKTAFFMLLVVIVVIVVVLLLRLGCSGGGRGAKDLGSVTCSLDHRLEAISGVSGVLDDAHGTVRLEERVLAADDVAVARFRVRLLVAGFRVLHAVAKLVVRSCLSIIGDKKQRVLQN